MEKLETSDYTRHYIVEALLKLMDGKDFHEITITEIVKKAGVGRATFYRSFADKESVLIYHFNRIRTKFDSDRRYVPRCAEDYYDFFLTILETLKQNSDILRTLQKSHLEYMLLDYLNERFAADFEDSNKPQNPFLPYAYAGSFYNISIQWLKTDCREPIETVAEALFISTFDHDQFLELQNHRKKGV